MVESDSLRISESDGVVTITFDNPSNHNAFNIETADELLGVVTALADDSDVRCIVLTHEGEYFATGANLTELNGDESDAPYIRKLASRFHDVIIQLHQAEIPIIGGVDGVAAGGGFSLTLLPDILLLSEDAHLQYAYPDIGLTGDGGVSFFLPQLVGLRTAKEITLLNDPILPERAVEMGLANEVVSSDEFDERLEELTTRVASGPTHALGTTMRLLTEGFGRDIESQLAAETESMAEAMQTEDYERGLTAFLEGEDPEFIGQ